MTHSDHPQVSLRTCGVLAAGLLFLTGCATNHTAPTGEPGSVQFQALPDWPPPAPPARPGQPVDFNTALKRAIEISPTVKVLEAAARTARHAAAAEGDLENPELRVGFSEADGSFDDTFFPGDATPAELESTDTSGEDMELALRFFPPNPFTSPMRKDAANANVLAAEMRVQQERVLVADMLRTTWLTLSYLLADRALARESFQALEKSAHTTVDLIEEGAATVLDAVDEERAALRSLLDMQEADEAMTVSLYELATLLHYDIEGLMLDGTEWKPLPTLDPASLDSRVIGELAVKHSFESGALDQDARVAEAAYAEARRAWIPWLSYVQVGIDESEGARAGQSMDGRTTRDAQEDAWSVSFAMEIPVFSPFHAEPGLLRAKWEELEVQSHISRELKYAEASACVDRVRRAYAYLKAYETRAAPARERLEKLVEQMSQNGTTGNGDTAKARSQLAAIKRQQLRLEFNLQSGLLTLENLTGLPMEDLF